MTTFLKINDKCVIVYLYSFTIWPDETWVSGLAVVDLFHQLETRVKLAFTEEDFERFRSGLLDHGLKLLEIRRVQFDVPERIK